MSQDIEIDGRAVRVFDSMYDLVKDASFSSYTQPPVRSKKTPFVDAVYPCYDERFSIDMEDYIRYQDGKFGFYLEGFDEDKGFRYIRVHFAECNEVESYIFEYALEDPIYLIYTKKAENIGYVTNGQIYRSRNDAEAIIKYGELPEPYKAVGIEIKDDFATVGALIIGLEQVLKELKDGQQYGGKIVWSLQMKTGQEEA